MPTGHVLNPTAMNTEQAVLNAVSDGSGTYWFLTARVAGSSSIVNNVLINADTLSPNGVGLVVYAAQALYAGGSNNSWDRERNNYQETVLTASAVATASSTSTALINFNARGVALFVNVTTGSVGGTIGTVTIQARVTTGGTYMPVYSFVQTTLTTGTAGFLLYPGAADAGLWTIAPVQGVLPRDWRVVVSQVSATATLSYTVTASYLL